MGFVHVLARQSVANTPSAVYQKTVVGSYAYETRYMQAVSAAAKTHQLDAPVTGTAVGLQQRLYSLRLCEALRR